MKTFGWTSLVVFITLCFTRSVLSQKYRTRMRPRQVIIKPEVGTKCPLEYIPLGDKCYMFSQVEKSWYEAFYDCEDFGGNLISIETEKEDAKIQKYLRRPKLVSSDHWTSGIYDWKNHQWVYGTNGILMNYFGFLTKVSPKSYEWFCIYLSPDLYYRWNHGTCFTKRRYICEKDQYNGLNLVNSNQ